MTENHIHWAGQVAVCLTCGAYPLLTGECPVHPEPRARAALEHLPACDMALPIAIRPPAPVCTCPQLDGAPR